MKWHASSEKLPNLLQGVVCLPFMDLLIQVQNEWGDHSKRHKLGNNWT